MHKARLLRTIKRFTEDMERRGYFVGNLTTNPGGSELYGVSVGTRKEKGISKYLVRGIRARARFLIDEIHSPSREFGQSIDSHLAARVIVAAVSEQFVPGISGEQYYKTISNKKYVCKMWVPTEASGFGMSSDEIDSRSLNLGMRLLIDIDNWASNNGIFVPWHNPQPTASSSGPYFLIHPNIWKG